MIDIKLLRDDPEGLKKAIARKKFTVEWDAILRLDEERRSAINKAETKRAEQKAASKEVGQFKDKKSPEFQSLLASMKVLADEVKELEAAAADIETQWKGLFLSIPNMPDASVPEGRTEEDNVVAATWGEPAEVSAHAVPHWDIPWFSQAIDFERGVKATGAGFPFYVGDMARLVRSLISFFLEEARLNGYEEVLPPLMVNAASATATGQLPDKEGQMYHMPVEDFYMIPTAEVPVTNFFREETFDEAELPVYRCGYTPCFRREAGSWGKHVRGLNRLHQFDKVELVKWVHPDKSFEELELLRGNAEVILQKLGLPYRVLLMCAGDIGFPHAKQYDLEVWAGGQQRWLEVSSCSNFTDFQARRAGIRFRPKGGGKAEIVHTLNGSGLAVPRVLAALLENNLQQDGTVKVPECLHRWCGFETLAPKAK
ncbi:serine--tRNA ligase [Ruficoccus amylovorans]|uniref:Serine--tRNA ligase n=1 Tax=Ruficoccus amylovorans TaxID=1804625 RepID=A0A842HCE6_9BACT|nr:serine--tRNA ligase [Ruficoccus amylovorans]MBC2594165.1 serine--tRNA ligase [Ruficoccus amylovorans]